MSANGRSARSGERERYIGPKHCCPSEISTEELARLPVHHLPITSAVTPTQTQQQLSPRSQCFTLFPTLANLDNEPIDRLSRYEARLWRQLVQTLFALQTLKRR